MIEKYKVTQDQHDTVSRLLGDGQWRKSELIASHEEGPDTWGHTESALNNMSLEALTALVFFPYLVEVKTTPLQSTVRSLEAWVPTYPDGVAGALIRAFSEMAQNGMLTEEECAQLTRKAKIVDIEKFKARNVVQAEVSAAVTYINDLEREDITRIRFLEGFVHAAEAFKQHLNLTWLDIKPVAGGMPDE